MLLFCDTSALIKLLIDEPDSAQIHQVTERARLIAACRITWAEAMAAMARRQRDDPTSADEIENARQRLSMLWSSFTIVEVSQKLVEAAGRFRMASRLGVTTVCSWLPPTSYTSPPNNLLPSPATTAD